MRGNINNVTKSIDGLTQIVAYIALFLLFFIICYFLGEEILEFLVAIIQALMGP